MTEAEAVEFRAQLRALEQELDELRQMVAGLLELAHKDQVDAIGRARERARVYDTYVAPAWEQTRSMTPLVPDLNKKTQG